jgi:hypothetical protein
MSFSSFVHGYGLTRSHGTMDLVPRSDAAAADFDIAAITDGFRG